MKWCYAVSVPIIFKTVQFLQGEDGKKSQGDVDQEQIKVWCQKYKLQCTIYEGIHWPSVYLCTALSPTYVFFIPNHLSLVRG